MGAAPDADGEALVPRDEPPVAWATGAILAGLLAAWLASSLRWGDDAARLAADAAGTVAPAVWGGEWWRLFAALLLLSDFFEMLLLGIVLCLAGRWLEERLGGVRVLVIYIAGGVLGQLAGMALDASPFVGAPEGIAAVLGASLVLLLSPAASPDGGRAAALGGAVFGLMLLGASYGSMAIGAAVASGALLTVALGRRACPARPLQACFALLLAGLAAFGAARALEPDLPRIAEYELQRGTDAWRADDRLGALRRWERATMVDPQCDAAWFDLSVAYTALGLPGPAARALDEARRLAPASAPVLGRLGELESAAGHPQRAERLWRMLLRNQPDQLDASLALAASLADQGSHGAARALYDSLAEAHPRDHAVLYQAAAWYDDEGGDTARAQALWLRLARLPAVDAADALRIARAQLVIGDSRAAEATVSQHLGEPSAEASAAAATLRARLLTLRANARAEGGRFEEALRDADAAASLGRPDWATAYLRARLAMWWRGDVAAGRASGAPPDAAVLWREAARLAASDYERDLSGGWEALDRDAAVAEQRARAVLEKRPRDSEARYLLGLALRAQGRDADAAAEITRAAALQPADRELREATARPNTNN